VMHLVQQRCARWLLMTHDRMHQQHLHLSHEFLAMMLGVQRLTVNVIAGTLQKSRTHSLRRANAIPSPAPSAQFDRLRQ